MKNVQEIFTRIQEIKKEQKDLRSSYRDALANSVPYQKILEELRVLKDKKRAIEDAIKSDSRAEMEKLDVLKNDLSTDMELLSDVALSSYAKGENVSVTDANENKYDPVFRVTFKRVY